MQQGSVARRSIVMPSLALLPAIGLLLAIAGAAIAGYLAIENLQGETGICVGVGGCETVQDSRYGHIFGMPVSIPGLVLYLGLALVAAAWLANARGQRELLTLVGFFGSLAGALFSAYLTYVEAFVLHAWCSYCIISAILMTALLVTWTAVLLPIALRPHH